RGAVPEGRRGADPSARAGDPPAVADAPGRPRPRRVAVPAGRALTDFDARILVVDDDKAVRAALRVNLEKAGLDVRLASTAEEALQVLHYHPVDIVLTEVK